MGRKVPVPSSGPDVASVFFDSASDTRYISLQFLGKGGFAKCYKVRNERTNEEWALKVIDKAKFAESQYQKFLREISIHRSMCHPNIVRLHAHFEDSLAMHMVMELCSDRTLLGLISESKSGVSELDAAYYLKGVVAAVQYMLDRGFLHRDIKPGNVLLSSGARSTVKLADFGLACSLEQISNQSLSGTPNYIAPEVLARKGHSASSEAWSLGCLLYCSVVGVPPFDSGSIQETYKRITAGTYSYPSTAELSANSRDLIDGLLHTNPDMRTTVCEIPSHPFLRLLTAPAPTTSRRLVRSIPNLSSLSPSKAPTPSAAPTIHSQITQTKASWQCVQGPSTPAPKAALPPPPPPQTLLASPRSRTVLSRPTSSCGLAYCPSPISNGGALPMGTTMVGGGTGTTNSSTAASYGNLNNNNNYLMSCVGMDTRSPHSSSSCSLSGGGTGGGGGGGGSSASPPPSIPTSIFSLAAVLDGHARSLHSALEGYSGIVPVFTGGANLPLHISKWVDYTNKYGFGCMLSDDTVAVRFNSGQSIAIVRDGPGVFVDSAGSRPRTFIAGEGDSHFRSLTDVALSYRNYMDRSLAAAVKRIGGSGDGVRLARNSSVAPSLPSSRDSGIAIDCAPIPYISHYEKRERYIAVVLSNGVVQINFHRERLKVVVSPHAPSSSPSSPYPSSPCAGLSIIDSEGSLTSYLLMQGGGPSSEGMRHILGLSMEALRVEASALRPPIPITEVEVLLRNEPTRRELASAVASSHRRSLPPYSGYHPTSGQHYAPSPYYNYLPARAAHHPPLKPALTTLC